MINKNSNSAQMVESNKRFNALKNEHNLIVPAYQTLSTYIDPTRGIFNNDRSRIYAMIDHKTLLDGHATHAKNITSAGMQTGMTDPLRPWFKLTMDDYYLNNVPGTSEWLDDVTARMFAAINKSNLYSVFQNCYDELTTFSTGCYLILDDYEDIFRGRSFTCGEYFLGIDNKGRVNSFAREFEMTVGQLVEEFGLESCSQNVKAQYSNNYPDVKIKVRHMIEPNETKIPGYEDFNNMAWRSWYWETSVGDGIYLAKRGYKRFRVIAPRWNTVTTDMVYGKGASWHAIGDIKQLQLTVKDMLLAQEKLHNPPTIEDDNVTGQSNLMPGGKTKSSSVVPNSGVRAAYQVDPRLDSFINAIDSLYKKIDKHLFADIFKMISNLEGQPNITAFQIAQIKQEQIMMMGPLLHSTNKEMHEPTIDLIFDIMNDAGLIPPAPAGLEGEIKVQYISILAQAQMAMGVQKIQSTIGYVASIAPIFPNAPDNIDIDEAVREMSKMNGDPARIISSKEEIDAIRKARLDQQNKAIAMQAGVQAADAASKLGKTPINGGPSSVLDGLAHAAGGG